MGPTEEGGLEGYASVDETGEGVQWSFMESGRGRGEEFRSLGGEERGVGF